MYKKWVIHKSRLDFLLHYKLWWKFQLSVNYDNLSTFRARRHVGCSSWLSFSSNGGLRLDNDHAEPTHQATESLRHWQYATHTPTGRSSHRERLSTQCLHHIRLVQEVINNQDWTNLRLHGQLASWHWLRSPLQSDGRRCHCRNFAFPTLAMEPSRSTTWRFLSHNAHF